MLNCTGVEVRRVSVFNWTCGEVRRASWLLFKEVVWLGEVRVVVVVEGGCVVRSGARRGWC